MRDFPWDSILAVLSALGVAALALRGSIGTARAQRASTEIQTRPEETRARTEEWSALVDSQKDVIDSLTARNVVLEGEVKTGREEAASLRTLNDHLRTLNETLGNENARASRDRLTSDHRLQEAAAYITALLGFIAGLPDPKPPIPPAPDWIGPAHG